MKPRELTIRGLILGALITAVFTPANIYLGHLRLVDRKQLE